MLVPYNDPFYYSRRPTLGVPAGQRAADRHRLVERRARPAPAAHRPEADLRSGASRAHPAHRLREPEPLALSGHRHLVDRRSGQLRRGSAGSDAISIRCRRRSIRWSAGTRRGDLPHVLQASTRRGAGDSRTRRATRSRARTRGAEATAERNDRAAHRLARAGRSARARVRLRQRAGGAGHARSRRHGGAATRPSLDVSRTPASRRRCRRSPARWSEAIGTQRLLRDDRRLRHARRRRTSTRPTARTTT